MSPEPAADDKRGNVESNRSFPLSQSYLSNPCLHSIPPYDPKGSGQNGFISIHLLSAPLHLQEQKKRVENILAEEATIDGLENVEVKVFK